MWFAYFDDSSDDKRERFMAAGGLVTHEAIWSAFELLWVNATHELSEPFRSTDCECGHGQFSNQKKWPKAKRDALMADLVTLIRDWRLGGFASVVPVADYKAVFPGAKKYDPYYLAIRHTLINMAHIGGQVGEVVKCWFEEGETSAETLSIYHSMKSVGSWTNRRYLGGVSFDSKKLIPLQAADLMAREAFKHMDNLGTREPRKPLKRLFTQISFHLWTRDTLEHLKSRGGPDDLKALTSWPDSSAPSLRHFYAPKRKDVMMKR